MFVVGGFILLDGSSLEHLEEAIGGVHGGNVVNSLEFANIMVLDSQVSEFLHVRLGGLLLDSGELSAQGLFVQVVGIRIFHPVDRVKISQARIDGLSVHVVIRRAVGSPRRFGVIGSSSGISIDVGRQKAIEHASTLAGFDVDHKLIIEA